MSMNIPAIADAFIGTCFSEGDEDPEQMRRSADALRWVIESKIVLAELALAARAPESVPAHWQ